MESRRHALVRGVQIQPAMRLPSLLVMLWAARAAADPAPAADTTTAPTTAAPTTAPAAASLAPPPSAPPLPAQEPAPLYLPLHAGLSVRGGFHHTHVTKGDGEPTGYGPKVDVELTVRPIPQLVLAGFIGYTSYASDHLRDGVTRQMYNVSFETWAIGGRLYVEPLPRFFLGLGVFDQSETERGGPPGSIFASTTSHEETHVQFIAGGNLVRLGHYTVQLAATYTQYDQYFELEHVVTYGLTCGIHGE